MRFFVCLLNEFVTKILIYFLSQLRLTLNKIFSWPWAVASSVAVAVVVVVVIVVVVAVVAIVVASVVAVVVVVIVVVVIDVVCVVVVSVVVDAPIVNFRSRTLPTCTRTILSVSLFLLLTPLCIFSTFLRNESDWSIAPNSLFLLSSLLDLWAIFCKLKLLTRHLKHDNSKDMKQLSKRNVCFQC